MAGWVEELIRDARHVTRVLPGDAPALAVYVAATGLRPQPMSGHAALIEHHVGHTPQAVRRWAEIVSTWVATHEPGHVGKVYNLSNVRRMVGAFTESVDSDPLPVSARATQLTAHDTQRELLREIGMTEEQITQHLAHA
jgi:hypothetical protein